jgi:hypothetical protein
VAVEENRRMTTEQMVEGIIDIAKTGSTVICDPAPTDTDEDWIVLTEDSIKLRKTLLAMGFKPDSDKHYEDSEFDSYSLYEDDGFFSIGKPKRKNYIVTESKRLFKAFVFATEVGRRLNIQDKRDRIDLFTIVKKYYEIN